MLLRVRLQASDSRARADMLFQKRNLPFLYVKNIHRQTWINFVNSSNNIIGNHQISEILMYGKVYIYESNRYCEKN